MKLKKRKTVILPLLIIFFTGCVTGVQKEEAARAYYNLGNAYFELENMERAAEAYLRALSLDDSLESASYNLARAYVESGYVDKGIEILEQLLAGDPENLYMLNTLAYAYSLKSEYEKALELYEDVLLKNNLNENALYNSGIIYWREEQYQKAKDRFNSLYSIKPEDNNLILILGRLELDMDNPEKGIRYLESYKEQNSEDTNVLRELGNAYRLEEYYGKALEVYNELLDISREEPQILFYKAWILLVAIGDTQNGLDALEDAIVAGFRNKEQYIELLQHPDIINQERVKELLMEKEIITEEDLVATSSAEESSVDGSETNSEMTPIQEGNP